MRLEDVKNCPDCGSPLLVGAPTPHCDEDYIKCLSCGWNTVGKHLKYPLEPFRDLGEEI